MEKSKKTSEGTNFFNMRYRDNEEEQLQALADAANTDKSAFVRKRVFSDEKIIILDKANYISRNLIEINDYLQAVKRQGIISDKNFEIMYSKLCEVQKSFMEINKELTVFNKSTEKGDKE